MTTAAGVVDARRYTQEYERLRAQVSGAAPGRARGLGLALLLRDGVPAWIRAVRQVLSEAAAGAAGDAAAATSHPPRALAVIPSRAADGDGDCSSPLVEPARQRDLTTLLASLVLSAKRATHPVAMKEPSPCQ